MFHFCSIFSLLFLHIFLYGCNIFMWRKKRINYSFIFEFSPTKELKYRDVFLICAASMALVVGVMFLHLTLLAKGYSFSQVQSIPGILLLVWQLFLLLSSRSSASVTKLVPNKINSFDRYSHLFWFVRSTFSTSLVDTV